MTSSSTKALLLLGVSALLATSAVGQTEEPKARPLLVGVVDLGVAFKGYKRKEEFERIVNDEKDQLEADAKRRGVELERLRRSIELFKEGTEGYENKKYELTVAMKNYELARDHANEVLKRRVENLTLQILDEINDGVQVYARAHNFDAILKADSKGWGEERYQERIFRAQVTGLMYFDRGLDVTAGVLEALNDPENLKKRSFR
jgi:Skp family chaperone for outer membrane proteins